MKMFDRYKAVVEAHKTTGPSTASGQWSISRAACPRTRRRRPSPSRSLKRNAGRWRLDHPRPTHPGLWFMDSSSAAAEMVTLCAASGFAVHTFPTGQGNVIGNPILPVIKLTANPRTQRTMSEHMDLDVTGLLQKKMNMDEAGEGAALDSIHPPRMGSTRRRMILGPREYSLTRPLRKRMTAAGGEGNIYPPIQPSSRLRRWTRGEARRAPSLPRRRRTRCPVPAWGTREILPHRAPRCAARIRVPASASFQRPSCLPRHVRR